MITFTCTLCLLLLDDLAVLPLELDDSDPEALLCLEFGIHVVVCVDLLPGVII